MVIPNLPVMKIKAKVVFLPPIAMSSL
jgi:hypothetical protein